ncbi:hypothetical protein BaRGS_00024438 [Batillaria attramentaria]|uniref:Uncharacterized protein n=1 Tax=Batillaria attramentaria TaxID=370345 RepID=A0ABD0KB33_9CAEN
MAGSRSRSSHVLMRRHKREIPPSGCLNQTCKCVQNTQASCSQHPSATCAPDIPRSLRTTFTRWPTKTLRHLARNREFSPPAASFRCSPIKREETVVFLQPFK